MILSLYLPLIYLAFFIIALLYSSSTHDWQGVIYLTLLYLTAWIDPIWYDARNLMLAELFLFSAMIFTYLASRGFVFSMIALAMVINNGLFLMTGWPEFYRLSVVNLLFLSLCIYTIITGYNTREVHNKREGARNGVFMARTLSGKKV